MQPLTVITGIVLGSVAAVAISLSVVVLLFLILSGKYPRLQAEFGLLLRFTALFVIMTPICAISFFAELKEKPWRWLAQAALWAGLAAIGLYTRATFGT